MKIDNDYTWKMQYKRNHTFNRFTFSEIRVSPFIWNLNFKPGMNYIEKPTNSSTGHVSFFGDKIWDKGVIKIKFLLEKNDPKEQNWFSYGVIGANETYRGTSFQDETNFQFSYSGDNKNYCGIYKKGDSISRGQFDIQPKDVFVVTLDFNKLELTSYNERSQVTMKISNIDNIPYRAHFNLYGVDQKIVILDK